MSYREHLAEQMETGRRIKQGHPHVEPRWIDEGRIAQRVARAMGSERVTVTCPVCGIEEVTVDIYPDDMEWETECSCGINHLVNEEAYREAIQSAVAEKL